MSRTWKGLKAIGYDYWSKRPYSGHGFGKIVKKLTHRKERAIDKQIEHDAKKKCEKCSVPSGEE
jgi:hypothetical protein